jgi:hypothetical protein
VGLRESSILVLHARVEGVEIPPLCITFGVACGMSLRDGGFGEHAPSALCLTDFSMLLESHRQPSFVERVPGVDLHDERPFATKWMRSRLRNPHALADHRHAGCDRAGSEPKLSPVIELNSPDCIRE